MGSFLSSSVFDGSDVGEQFSVVDKSMNAMIFQPPQLVNERTDGDLLKFTLKDKEVYAMLYTDRVSNKIIVFSHGNAGNIFTNSDYLKQLSKRMGVNVLSYDYPGYGLTQGKATDKGCCECLNIVMTSLLEDYKPENIFLMGHSLGTGVVVDYAYEHECKTPIILISPYKSIPCVGFDLSVATSIVKKYKFDTSSKIGHLKCTVLILHSEVDDIIPISHSKHLYDKLLDKSIDPLWIKNVGHNDILEQEITFRAINKLIYPSCYT